MNSILQSYLAYKEEIDKAIFRTLSSGTYIMGTEVAGFERSLAEYLGVKYAIGVGNGTDAIQIGLRAANIGPGDEVITVSHTAVATVAAISQSGAKPVLVDVNPRTYTLDPEQLPIVFSERTRAVIPVHLYGHPVDIRPIMDFCQEHNLTVIEDCAQSHGASIGGKKTGSFGDVNAFSFYPTKNLGAMGDGGAVVTDDPNLAKQCRAIRQYGWLERNNSKIPGINSRLDELQAAILSVKLHYLETENKRRQRIAQLYDENLPNVETPHRNAGVTHVFHQYVIQTQYRNELQNHLAAQGISTQVHYPIPVHLQDTYRGSVKTAGSLHCTENLCTRILSLPMHPWLEDEDIMEICKSINQFFST